MKEDERRALLRSLADDEYRDVMSVCATLPNVTMEVNSKGIFFFIFYLFENIYTGGHVNFLHMILFVM